MTEPGLRPGVSETFPYPQRLLRVVGGDPIAYFDTERGPEGPPALLIHGLGANYTHWEHIAPALAVERRVLGIDLPGCGDSLHRPARCDRPGPYSMGGYVDTCAKLLDQLRIERAVVVGHSLGGMVAAELALTHPSRVSELVLIDSAGFRRYSWLLGFLAARLSPPFVAYAMELVAERLLDRVFHRPNPRVQRFLGQTRGRAPRPAVEEFARMACAILPEVARRNLLDRVETIAQPSLVVWGERDQLVPLRGVSEWVRRLPQGRLEVIEGCGHMPIIERPEAVTSAIARFLAESQQAKRQVG